MSRVQQDQVIDDDEGEACPLCIEEFDLADRNFRPCPCGFQICQFCFNNIKNVHNGLCPGCRRPYDEKTIQWKAPSAEEFASYRESQAQQQKKKAAARQKEAQKREADTQSRKHLSGIRVRQKNLVYVTGLKPSISEEQLVQALRTDQYFGQYGKIVKIVVSKAKDTAHGSNSVGVYITYARREDAATCIQAVDGMPNGDGKLRAQYGTTKYCSSYLRNENCHNRNCMFLHEPGEENESFTRQDLSSFNVISTQSPTDADNSSSNQQSAGQAPPQQAPQPIAAATQAMDRQDSREGHLSSVDSNDGSALPSTASWGVKQQSRRTSQAASAATPSPLVSSAIPLPQVQEAVQQENRPSERLAKTSSLSRSTPVSNIKSPVSANKDDFGAIILDLLAHSLVDFHFDESRSTPEELSSCRNFPPLFDITRGLKRHAFQAQEHERRGRESENLFGRQSLSSVDMDEAPEGGSTQLGGEPEEQQDLGQDRHQQHAIQPPQDAMTSPFGLGHTLSPSTDLSNSSANGRSVIPQHQQQYLLQHFKSTSPGLPSGSQGSQLSQQGSFPRPGQLDGSGSSHTRQASRFSFANDTASASASVKPVANPKLLSQQSSMMPPPNHFNSASQHQNASNQYFSSGVQGPPPGLKVTGTPPVSGGGMFGQGHGFATAGLNYNVNSTQRNTNDEMMREIHRNRGSSTGSGQLSDAGKREFMFPSFLQHHSNSSTPAPVPGLLSFPNGPQPGAFQDHGPQKHKKKGKKHRHANTSSSGGGVVDVADPIILQARMHQAGNAGQGFYGSQGQDSSILAGFKSTLQIPDPFTSTTQHIGIGPSSYSIPSHIKSQPPIGLASHQVNQQADWALNPFQTPLDAFQSEYAIVPGLGAPLNPPAPQNIQSEPATQQTTNSRPPIAHITAQPKPLRLKLANTVVNAIDDASFPALPKISAPARSKETGKRSSLADSTTSLRPPKSSSEEPKASANESVHTLKAVEKNSVPPQSNESNRQHLGKLDIAAATDATATSSQPSSAAPILEKRDTPVQTLRDIADSASSSSRPTTPGAISETPAKKSAHPRTIRVLATPKAEIPSPPLRIETPVANSTTGTASPAPKAPSRRPSVGSINIPSTPLSEKISDVASATTDSVSRAGSPQPVRVDSASAHPKAKGQRKRERQDLVKSVMIETNAKEEKKVKESSPIAVDKPVVHEPVVGRKKKSKKPVIASVITNNSTPTASRPVSPGPKRDDSESQSTTRPSSPTLTPSKPAPPPAKSEKEANNKGTPVSAQDSQKSLPFFPSILGELFASNSIKPSMTEFFKAGASFNHPYDITITDLSNSLPGFHLTDEDFERLDAGLPVRHQDGGETRFRTLLTPYRRSLVRGLSKEMEDYFMELEDRVARTNPPLKYTHRRNTPVGDETSNAAAGARIAEQILKDDKVLLCRPANANNIVDPMKKYGDETLGYLNQFILPPLPPKGMSDDTTPSIGNAIPRIYTTGDPTYSVYGADVNVADKIGPQGKSPLDDLSATQAPAVRQALASAMRYAGVLGAEDAEQAMLNSRKECEALEKRVATLIKKNKRLAFGTGQ